MKINLSKKIPIISSMVFCLIIIGFGIFILSSNSDVKAFSVANGECKQFWNNSSFEVVKCKIDGKDYVIANKKEVAGGIAIK
jgi:hypothetical protein